MIKYIFLMLVSLWVAACAAHDEHYYSVHPKLLQQAIGQCPAKQPKGISCAQLNDVAVRVNEFAYQLGLDPQGYGKKILALQEMIAKQELALQELSSQPELKTSLADNKQRLQERLAIVKWLESPHRGS